MARYGIAGFLYDLEVEDGDAHFVFEDPEDPSNTAEVVIAAKDFPNGTTAADSRPIADMAYLQCAKLLNDKRDARLQAAANAKLADSQAAEAQRREAAQDYLSHIQDVATEPHHVEKDGTRVYNVASPDGSESAPATDTSANGKKK